MNVPLVPSTATYDDIDPPICPCCEGRRITKRNVSFVLQVAAGPLVPVTIPVWWCGACDWEWREPESQEIIDAAVRSARVGA